MNKRLFAGKTIGVISLLIVLTMLFAAVSFAWLVVSVSDIDASEIGGQLLTNYFHSGDGSPANPFVITRPIHYYNLVNLYQRVSDYSDEQYCFQLGTQLIDGDSDCYVYNYDANGNLDEDAPYAKVLNLAYYCGGNELLPIGTHDKNFLGSFNGNGLTVKNLTVSTLENECDCDIGIFGFVGDGAVVENVYFSNVTIDLSNVSSASAVVEAHSDGQTHKAKAHEDESGSPYIAYVGYVAGHAITNAQFNDVYINDVSIVGGGDGTAARSGFGYFGCLENLDGSLVPALGDILPQTQSNGISMGDMYDRLTTIRDDDTKVNAIPFVVSKSVWVHGSFTEDIPGSTVTSSVLRGYDTESAAGSFVFSKESPSSEGTTVYLAGKGTATQTVTTLEVKDKSGGFYLTSQSGQTYLQLNGTHDGLTTVTQEDDEDPTVWAFEGEDNVGRFFTTVIDDVNHCCHYYYIKGNSITATEAEATEWTYDAVNNQMYYDDANNVRRYLAFYGEGLEPDGGNEVPKVIRSGDHYISLDTSASSGNNIADSDISGAAIFQQEAGTDYWYTLDSSDTKYYLTAAAGVLRLTNNPSHALNTWSITNGWVYDNKIITYNESTSQWGMSAITTISTNFIGRKRSSDNNYYYMDVSGTSITNQTVSTTDGALTLPTSGATWLIPAVGSPGTISTIIGGETYYLVATRTTQNENGGTGLGTLTLEKSGGTTWTRSGSSLYCTQKWVNASKKEVDKAYYINFDTDGTWKIMTSQSNSNLTIRAGTGGDITIFDGSAGEDQELNTIPGNIVKEGNHAYQIVESSSEENSFIYPDQDTWFPILANADGTPAAGNFGYVVSGMNYHNQEGGFYQAGDIRVTMGSKDLIQDSYSDGAITNVYTVKSGGTVNMNGTSGFSVYDSAKTKFTTLLSGENLYGLHFMGSAVSHMDKVTVPSVAINGIMCADLPRHCVDVAIQNKGYITMFAGNYTEGNTEFFSLYHILRDETNAVSSVKKISKIYKVGVNIQYAYVGESDPYDIRDLVFDSAWMAETAVTGQVLYYFEIPVAAGEYAIGAVDGNDGAYLLYLDTAEACPDIGSIGNGLSGYDFKVDVRSADAKVDHSLLQFAVDAPSASPLNFSVDVSFAASDQTEYANGLYTISVVNRTGSPIDITVFLCDDDNIAGNPYLYAYKVVYTNSTGTATLMNGSLDYFQSCAVLTIPE